MRSLTQRCTKKDCKNEQDNTYLVQISGSNFNCSFSALSREAARRQVAEERERGAGSTDTSPDSPETPGARYIK